MDVIQSYFVLFSVVVIDFYIVKTFDDMNLVPGNPVVYIQLKYNFCCILCYF